MRVLIITPDFYRSSGVTHSIKSLFLACKEYKSELDFYFISCNQDQIDEDVKWLPSDKLKKINLMTWNPFLYPFLAIELLRFIRNKKINIVHVHHRRLLIVLGYLLKILRIPVVYTGHLTYSSNLLFRYSHSDLSIAVTNSVAQNIRATTIHKNVKTISNIVIQDNQQVQFAKNKEKAKVECAVIGRLEKVKNHSIVLDACKYISNIRDDFKLYIVGEGSLRQEIEKFIEDNDLVHIIELKGYLPNVQEFISEIDFLILPSFVEGQGLVTIEGALLKKPTLLSLVDGSIDCIPDDLSLPNGFNPNDTNEFTEYFRLWLSEPNLVKNDGLKFFNKMREEGNPQSLVTSYFKACEDLM